MSYFVNRCFEVNNGLTLKCHRVSSFLIKKGPRLNRGPLNIIQK